jgi:hypothetical protein
MHNIMSLVSDSQRWVIFVVGAHEPPHAVAVT